MSERRPEDDDLDEATREVTSGTERLERSGRHSSAETETDASRVPEMFTDAPSTTSREEQSALQVVNDGARLEALDEQIADPGSRPGLDSGVQSALGIEHSGEGEADLEGGISGETSRSAIDPLPRPEGFQVDRDADGLIIAVDGKPAEQFVGDLADDRAARYLELQSTGGEFSRKNVGEVSSVLFDRRTGELYEATNGRVPRVMPDNLHPVLQERVNALRAQGKAAPEGYDYGPKEGRPDKGPFPHPSFPGTHAEVKATSQALYDREAQGLDASPGALRELVVDSRFPFGARAGQPAPCCPNCTVILGEVGALAGKRPGDEFRR